ncbi:DNA cytosine methyltransferase [Clostridium botulinum]|uniref:DNA cytosine methyltransferase n=1 Tax=Clostridium botulinum TaxID=1491 RepID=UPI0001591F60|nr:DNA cytosine methyltransferase [Clostridium botulinum]NFM26156.1 DNA cytosine methyltransferase [Clostridium sporogenes]ABS34971.1 DNA-cytosine methyltransferase family protein [Clostridium botulinum A str. ATCC 19397]ABS35518.1 DNA-cytosine methyltransferase family protein [Clostridium botulinum A str. ATCC 19397]ABS36567.1 DNA-cytosine methyltransferase family protein [Clostridium botulinum A str. Hall]ABS36684.1 DNA-cytosine methyltransferase family protein [Clostridium botulinum A str. 
MIQILELFGGIGAPRKALINLGVPVKAIDYVEIDEKAVRSYNAIFHKDLAYKTQSVVGYNLKPDILIHGSPCQDFSIAGHQKGADKGTETRSSLMWETINIIEQMGVWKPKYVIWENVKNVLSKHMRHNFNKYLDEMQNMGYTSNFEVLNALDFGLPQKRERVFTISCLDGTLFNFNALERKKAPHIREFLEDTQEEKYIVTQPSMLKKMHDKNGNFGGRVEVINDCCSTITTKQMRCPNSGVVDLGNGKYRYLTELECWRLQGYSDEDFYNALNVHSGIPGKLNGALYKQAGNSIPITILEAIFKVITNEYMVA